MSIPFAGGDFQKGCQPGVCARRYSPGDMPVTSENCAKKVLRPWMPTISPTSRAEAPGCSSNSRCDSAMRRARIHDLKLSPNSELTYRDR